MIGLVFAAQIALIFRFGARTSPPLPKVDLTPAFHLTSDSRGQFSSELEDPTLFAMPHQQSFSGEAWLKVQPHEFAPANWSEPPNLLALNPDQLGTRFRDFVETNRFAKFQTANLPEPSLTFPELPPIPSAIPPSSLAIGGRLAGRQLLSHFDLPPQTSPDILTNSVVQVLVNARGDVISAVLLPPGSGSKDADQLALEKARTARFDSIEQVGPERSHAVPELEGGRLIFTWETIAPTNSPAAIP